MAPARGRNTNKPTTRKRGTGTTRPQPNNEDEGTPRRSLRKRTAPINYGEQEQESESGKFYLVKEVLDANDQEYFVEWEGQDEDGNPYPPSWIAKSLANAELVRSYEEKLKEENDTLTSTRKKRTRRKRPVIEFSSEKSTVAQTSASVANTRDSQSGVDETDTPSDEQSLPLPPRRTALRVEVQPPSDFEPADYERFFQLPSSNPRSESSGQSQDVEEAPTSQSTSATPNSPFSRVIPESQSSNGIDNNTPVIVETAHHTTTAANDICHDSVTAQGPIQAHESSAQVESQESQSLLEIPESPTQPEPVSSEQERFLRAPLRSSEGVSPINISRSLSNPPVITAERDSDLSRHSEPPTSRATKRRKLSATQNLSALPNSQHESSISTLSAVEHSQGKAQSTRHHSPQISDPKGNNHQSTTLLAQDNRTTHRDFAIDSQGSTTVTEKTTQDSSSHKERPQDQEEQNAQVVPSSAPQDTLTEEGGSVRITTEAQPAPFTNVATLSQSQSVSQPSPPLSPDSREKASDLSGSLPLPPEYSIRLPDSPPPPRPETPDNVSSISAIMDKEAKPEKSIDEIDDDYEGNRRRNPFIRTRKSLLDPTSSPAGTRSPSVIPARSPQRPQESSSLREAVLMQQSASAQISEEPSSLVAHSAIADAPQIDAPLAKAAPDAPAHPEGAEEGVTSQSPTEDEVIPDAEPEPGSVTADTGTAERTTDDSNEESFLEDDIPLQPAEYIVSLPLVGRQKDMYANEIRNHKDLLGEFWKDYQDLRKYNKVLDVFDRLKRLEDHVDLVYAESQESVVDPGKKAKWDWAECVKFRFLGALFLELRDQGLHVVVVVHDFSERLLELLETFCRGRTVNFRRMDGQGIVSRGLKVTGVPSDSTHLLPPADVIISLNGADTASIRQKSWAKNPDVPIVPVLQLVVPDTVGHIERYVPSTLTSKRRLHTIFAALGQILSKDRRSSSPGPKAKDSAELVAQYLISLREHVRDPTTDEPDWPLSPIESIMDCIEFTSTPTPAEVGTPVAAPPGNNSRAASKRPLDTDGVLEPSASKRMRLTPQPRHSPTRINDAAEITHISDSMPGTAVEPENLSEALKVIEELQKRLSQANTTIAEKNTNLHNARITAQAERSKVADWEKRQFQHEDVTKKYRLQLGEVSKLQEAIIKRDQRLEFQQRRYDKQGEELERAREEIKDLSRIYHSSDDEKMQTIADLKAKLQDAEDAKNSAVTNKASLENQTEYLKDQMYSVRERATELATQNAELVSSNESLSQKASTNQVELKKIFYDKNYTSLKQRHDNLKSQVDMQKKIIDRKDEEIARLKQSASGRGYGTRGSSLPRSPNPRAAGGVGSRAASPSNGGRDRLQTLRNG